MLLFHSILVFCLISKSAGSVNSDADSESVAPTESTTRDLSVRHRLKEKPSLLHHPVFLLDRFSPGDPVLPVPDGKGPNCRREAKCERLNNSMCLGAKLPYSSTTLQLVGMTQEQIQEKLQFWMALKHVPRCWAVIQPFLCALYMPRCDNDLVDLPSQEMCRMALGPCRILELERGWTSPLRCDDTNRFPPLCKNDVREMRFNTTAECLAPLVPTDNPSAFYEGTEGCGLQCANPMFTPDEHRQIHELIAWAGGTCLIVNLFTVASFLIDWRSANKYPALIIFYINCCFLMVCVGFLAQFLPGAREGIVCRKDGTLRMSEPSAGENLSCVIIFVLIYYSLMAACVWFVILAYAWHLSFRALGKIQDRIDKKGAYFHLVAWSLPLVLTITTMALGEIDANSEMGICFVGYMNPAARGALLLGPIAVFYAAGGYFLFRGLFTLIKVKINSHEIISERASAKIRETIVRMGFFTLFTFIFVVLTFIVHIYEFQHRRSWKESFRTFMICKIMRSGGVLTDGVGLTGHGDCRMEVRPSLAMVQLHLLALFTAGVVMSSWVWTSSTVDTWIRFIRRTFHQDGDEPVKMKKHKVIAQVFAKRQAFNRAGRISISFHSTHDDPVGLNFELNSVASRDMSTTWAAALPNFVCRRGALILRGPASISSQYRNSFDSRVSLDSRRQSLDSQLSIALGDFIDNRKAGSTPVPPATPLRVSGGRGKPRHKRKKHHFRRSRIGLYNRRGSTTSQESQLGAQILSTYAIGNPHIPSLVPNLKRRTGNAGLNGDQLLPSSLTAGGIFGFHDPSDITDDDIPKAPGTHVTATGEDTNFQKTLETKLNCISTLSNKSQGQISPVANDVGRRGSKSSGNHQPQNGRGSRHSSSDSSLSPEHKSSSGHNVRNGEMNGVSMKNSEKSNENLVLLNSRELKQEIIAETKTHNGKKYTKVESDVPDVCSDDDNSLDSDEENVISNSKINKKTRTNSHSKSGEFRKSPNENIEMKEVHKEYDDLSEGSSTSCSQELSGLALKSSLSGISCGPSKQITVSSLRNAREVCTQTSLSSGLNEIGTTDNERSKFICATQASHHSTTGSTRSENIYRDITSNNNHILGLQDEVTHHRAKSCEVESRRSSSDRIRSPNVA